MSNEINIFKNEEFGEVRISMLNNEPLFCLSDICRVLEISNSRNVKNRLMQNGVHTMDTIDSYGRTQSATFINEPNLYKVIFQSRKESAEKFTDWVTSEVLPSIRKTGSYSIPQTTDGKITLLAQGHVELSAKIDKLEDEVHDIKYEMPILPCEADVITREVKKKGVDVLGGKESFAYKNRSLTAKVYSDIYGFLKRNFGVKTYKAIKRSQIDKAVEIICDYSLPFCLKNEIDNENKQTRLSQ